MVKIWLYFAQFQVRGAGGTAGVCGGVGQAEAPRRAPLLRPPLQALLCVRRGAKGSLPELPLPYSLPDPSCCGIACTYAATLPVLVLVEMSHRKRPILFVIVCMCCGVQV